MYVDWQQKDSKQELNYVDDRQPGERLMKIIRNQEKIKNDN